MDRAHAPGFRRDVSELEDLPRAMVLEVGGPVQRPRVRVQVVGLRPVGIALVGRGRLRPVIAEVVHARRVDGLPHLPRGAGEPEQRVLAELEQDGRVRETGAADRAQPLRVLALEDHDEPRDPPLDLLLVDEVGLVQAGLGPRLRQVLHLDSEGRTVGNVPSLGHGAVQAPFGSASSREVPEAGDVLADPGEGQDGDGGSQDQDRGQDRDQHFSAFGQRQRRVLLPRGSLIRGARSGPMLPPLPGLLNRFGYISSRMRIRSWIGGWVENSFSSHPICSPGTLDGWDSHRCAVALLADRMGVWLAAILRSAAARPGG